MNSIRHTRAYFSIVMGVAKIILMKFEFSRHFPQLDAHGKKARKFKLHKNHFRDSHVEKQALILPTKSRFTGH